MQRNLYIFSGLLRKFDTLFESTADSRMLSTVSGLLASHLPNLANKYIFLLSVHMYSNLWQSVSIYSALVITHNKVYNLFHNISHDA